MPGSSPPGSVLRWPSAAEVLTAADRWAAQQQHANPDLLAVGVFGSYGRGEAGVGSDLDLVLILRECSVPIWERLRRWETGSLPLSCDLLVYSLKEWQTLPHWNPRLAVDLGRETRWLGVPDPAVAARKATLFPAGIASRSAGGHQPPADSAASADGTAGSDSPTEPKGGPQD